MKRLLILFLIVFAASTAQGALYYTCNTTSGTNLTSDATGGGLCNVGIGTWNQAGNTVIVRNGTTLTLTSDPFDLICNITVANGGTLLYDSGNNADFNILANSVLIVNGLFEIDDNNVALNISTSGLLIVNAAGTVTNNGSNNNDIVVNGDITGSGTIDFSGSIGGNGTINGQPAGGQTPPINLEAVGIIWNGTQWADQNGVPTPPSRLIDRAIFTGNYSSSADATVGPTWPGDGITINSGVTVTFEDDDDLSNLVSVRLDGTVGLVDNTTISAVIFADPASTGAITLKRNFTRSGWQHFGFPIDVTTKGVGDLIKTGQPFNLTNPPSNQTNIYYWDAATAAWLVPSASTLLTRPFDVYSFGAGEAVELTVSILEFNNNPFPQPYTYFDPGNTSAPINGIGWTNATTDGWNMWINPYQSYLESDNLGLPADLVGGVYVWDGTQYLTRNGGSGAAEFIGPHQAFFVRTAANTGSYAIPESARNPAPVSAPNYFKTSNEIELELAGSGVQTSTFLVQNPLATSAFDDDYDAYYFFGANTVFNTVGVDSTAYSVNQVPQLNNAETYVSFYHPQNNESFTISIDQNKSASFGSVILQDLFTGTATDLKNGDYTFTSTTAAPAQRFKLITSAAPVNVEEYELESAIAAWVDNNGELLIESAQDLTEAQISIYSMNGQLISQGSVTDTHVLPKTGVYIVNITLTDQTVKAVKVVKM